MVIYLLKNKITNDVYIGQTANFKNRICKYRTLNCKQQPKLYNSIVKNGFENFEVYILQNCNSKQELDEYEKYYIDLYKSNVYGYNCSEGGEGTTLGHRFTRPPRTQNHRENLSKSQKGRSNGRKGELKTEQQKINLRNANTFRAKPIICLDTQIVYPSIKEACRQLAIDSAQLAKHLKGKPHHHAVKSLRFRYI